MNDKLTKTVAIFAITTMTLLSAFAANAAEQAALPRPAIELGAPFADNAILQRQMPVPVWGWSIPGTVITVEFAGQKKNATTDQGGKWMLKLDALKANAAPQEMVIADSSGKVVTLKNILVGEVWLASGQSNMQWIVSKSDVGRVLLKGISERVEAGTEKPPIIREAKVTNFFAALHPVEHAEGEWSSDFGNFSAISFAFAYELYRELGVPVGILNCSFSQTSIEAWTPRVGFAAGKDQYTQSVYQKILETDPTTPEHKAAWSKFYQDIENTISENAERIKKGQQPKAISTKTPGNLSGNRDASWLFNARLNPMIPYAIRGGIWNQGYANMGAGLVYYNNLHSMIRGWRQLWRTPDLPVYFHQFYCPGVKGGRTHIHPSIGSTAEMRLGTWLARDIPNANMASQIDIEGAIHYGNKALPGKRLALHALKNQYGKKLVSDGPMFKSYTVEGNKLIIEFDHAQGGLVVAETGTNSKNGIADPTIIPNGDAQVKLFYLADENRLWHPAAMKIDGDKVIVSSAAVKSPCGVSYGTGGVGFQPNLYNKSLLPMTPFIYYDHKLVTKETWPDDPIKIAGVVPDPASGGKIYEYRKMPILSTQFRDNAVLQAGVPLTFWGSAVHDWGYEADGEAVIKFSFDGIKKSIPVTPGMNQWRYTIPAQKASAEPKTLKVALEIDGEVVHERVVENIVIGDVWYVAAPSVKVSFGGGKADNVRVMTRKCKRSMFHSPSRYTLAVSSTPLNRFASVWTDASGGLAGALGQRIAAKTGNPVGIILMQGQATVVVDGKSKGAPLELKHWIPVDYLQQAPSLKEDYKQLATVKPGNAYYDANAKSYIAAWKKHWNEYIPELMATGRVPDGIPWGSYPSLSSSITTDASQAYNVMTHSFGPGNYKGIIFLSSENMFEDGKAANYGPELSALANGWMNHFGGEDPRFFYTIPGKSLAPQATQPNQIKGKSTALEIGDWSDDKQIQGFIDKVINETYK